MKFVKKVPLQPTPKENNNNIGGKGYFLVLGRMEGWDWKMGVDFD